MRKLSLGAAIVAFVGLASPAAAADWSLCGTSSNGFLSCASANASISGSVLTVTVNNLYPGQGDQHVITGFGFYYSGLGTAGATFASGPANWDGDLGSLGAPGPESPPSWTWFATSSTNGAGNAIGHGGSGVFTFNLTGTLTDEQLQSMNFAFRAQSTGPDGSGSIKCYSTDSIESEHSCVPVTAVPEPATLALMGTGLLGLAGVGAVRRRRNGQLA